MEKYVNLDKFNRKFPQEDLNKELIKRKNAYGTLNTGLMIRARNKRELTSELFELFSVNNHEIIHLKEKIYQNSKKILKLSSKLPDLVQEPFILKLLVNEIWSSNEVEGVKSTKKEIQEAINYNASQDKHKSKRFVSLVNQYELLINENYSSFDNPQDIRDLYDKLLYDEIEDSDKPDGQYFRNGNVRIGNDMETVHQPKSKEKDILDDIYQLISFKNKYIEYDPLVVSAIIHYFFEYIHPFYDGNGRLGRYIYCSQIGEYVDKYSALCFSYTINVNKKDYYEEFARVPNKRNYGEITLFVEMMLRYLEQGQESILEHLGDALRFNKYIVNKLDNTLLTDMQKNFIYNLLLRNKFDVTYNEGVLKNVYVEGYYKNRSISKTQINKELLELEEKNIICRIKKRPIRYVLTEEFLEDFLISE